MAASSEETAIEPMAEDSEPTEDTEVASLSPSFDCDAAESSAEQPICSDADAATFVWPEGNELTCTVAG